MHRKKKIQKVICFPNFSVSVCNNMKKKANTKEKRLKNYGIFLMFKIPFLFS